MPPVTRCRRRSRVLPSRSPPPVLSPSAAFRERPVAFWGLIALALPVLPSLQFTLGYPMRVISATLAVGLLQAQGLMVARQGTFLLWRDEMVQFDAPCSGVSMLWASLLLTLMGCVVRLGAQSHARWRCRSRWRHLHVLRASSFYVETGCRAAPGWWQ
jgi:hypothetical protein